MSEMVERSARAMVVRTAELTGGDPETAWGGVGPLTQKFMYQMAEAVLQAIREPTVGMLAAANGTDVARVMDGLLTVAAVHGSALPDRFHAPNEPLRLWWRAMIEAALSEV
jgi:hypothetical protein